MTKQRRVFGGVFKAKVALAAVKWFLESSDALSEVVFVLFSQIDFNLYLNMVK